MNDLISVVVPIYHSELYLENCLDSILNQTYKNIELVLVLDGSNNESKSITYKYQKNDKRIKIIDRENKGAFYSRIDGVKNSLGKYVTFVDSDDYIENNYIEVLYNNLVSSNVDIVRCNYKIFSNNKFIYEKKVISSNKVFEKDKSFNYIYELLYNSIYFNSMCKQLVKKELFDSIKDSEMDFSINYGEDLLCEIELLNKVSSIMLIPDYLYIYNQNNNSVTFTNNCEVIEKKINSVCKVNYKMYNDISKLKIDNKEELYELCIVKFFYNLLNQYINLVKVNGYYSIINDIYINEKYKMFFNKKVNGKYLKNYNIIYRIGIKKIMKKETKSLVSYINLIVIPLLKLKRR